MKTKSMKALSVNELKSVNGGCSNCILANMMKKIYGEDNPLFFIDDICHTNMGNNIPRPDIM